MIIYNTRLTFQDARSNKEYNVWLEHAGTSTSLFDVQVSYGRIGSNLTRLTKNTSPLDLNSAKAMANKLIDSKVKKGYVLDSHTDNTSDTQPSGSAASKTLTLSADCIDTSKHNSDLVDEPCFTITENVEFDGVTQETPPTAIFKPQLLNPVTPERAAVIISEDWIETYFCQIKADGERRLVQCNDEGITALNKRGLPVALNPDFVADVKKLAGGQSLFIDCEDMGSAGLFVFDVLAFNGVEYSDIAFEQRASVLADIANAANAMSLTTIQVLLPVPINDANALHNAIAFSRENKEEGIVLRRGSALYMGGRPNKEGDALKIKNINSASVIVLEQTANKRSVAIGMYNSQQQLVNVGKVTIPQNHSIPSSGAIVEVNYLYVNGAKGALYQPVYKGDRSHELTHGDCSTHQLVYKKEAVAA